MSSLGEGRYYVYTLAYPDSMGGRVFYVGKGQGYRINNHEGEAKGKYSDKNAYKSRVIRKIWANGGEVVKTKIAYFQVEEDALTYEIALIFFMYGLTNLTDGGEGTSGRVFSEATLKKLRSKNTSEAARQKISQSRKGTTFSEEHRRNISEALKGRNHSPASREKMRQAHLGKSHAHLGKKGAHSEETKQKISLSLKKRSLSEENRQKLRDAAKRPRRPLSEEHRRKLSEAATRQHERKRNI